MSQWYVQIDGKTKTLSEERLRRRLRQRDLSGMELARPEGAEAWTPLHDLPIFREEVPMVGGDASRLAASRAARGFLGHLLTFLAVVGMITLQAGFPFWALFWGIGLVMHGARTLPAIALLRGSGTPAQATDRPEAQPAAPELQQAVTESGFLRDLDRALAELSAAARDAGMAAPDVDAIRRAARPLHDRHRALAAAADPAELEQLQLQRAQADARLASATDARLQEACAAELAAIDARIDGGRMAADAVARLAAQERALLHQVQGMRTATLQAAANEDEMPDLADRVRQLREQVQAGSEVDEALARARRAAAAQRQG